MTDVILLWTLVFLSGLTASGLSAAVLELRHGVPVRLDLPFVMSDKLGRSLLCVALAGPMMVLNEVTVFAETRLRSDVALLAALFCLAWILALGIVVAAALDRLA